LDLLVLEPCSDDVLNFVACIDHLLTKSGSLGCPTGGDAGHDIVDAIMCSVVVSMWLAVVVGLLHVARSASLGR
jgi:hypothetical protein